jgi:putative transposase
MAQRVEHHPLEDAFAALLLNGLDGAGEALRILVNEASKIERAQYLNAQSSLVQRGLSLKTQA